MMHICVMSSHKPIRIYMEGLILGVTTLYRLFCFFKLFPMVGKWLTHQLLTHRVNFPCLLVVCLFCCLCVYQGGCARKKLHVTMFSYRADCQQLGGCVVRCATFSHPHSSPRSSTRSAITPSPPHTLTTSLPHRRTWSGCCVACPTS